MIETAKKRLSALPNVVLEVNDGVHIPFPDSHFDLIFSHQVFPALSRKEFIETYFSEISRTLKPNGIAKLELRTGKKAYKWSHTYGVSVEPDWIRSLAERFRLQVLDTHTEGDWSLWVTTLSSSDNPND